MADFSHLSDEELDAAIKAKSAPTESLSHLSDEELDHAIKVKTGGEDLSLGQGLAEGFHQFGRRIDSLSGAPTRSAIYELTRTTPEFGKEEPSVLGNIGSAIKAGWNQFGAAPETAPTGKDIAEKRFGASAKDNINLYPTDPMDRKLGISTGQEFAPKVSTAGLAGTAINLGADPLNVLPVETIVKGIGKGAAKTGTGLVELAGKTASKVPGANAAKEVTSRLIEDFVKPSQSKNFAELSAIADKHAVDLTKAPEAVEFGKSSVISRLGRSQAEGPAGQAKLENYRSFIGDTTRAYDDHLAKISGGPALSADDIGSQISVAYDKSLDNLFKQADTTYKGIVDTYPGLRLSKEAAQSVNSKLNGIEKFAKGQLSRGIDNIDRAQGQQLLNAVAAARRTNGSVKQSVEAMQMIGKKAFQKSYIVGQVPPDIEKMQDLYFTLRDSIHDTIMTDVKDGPAISGALKISNDMISNFIKDSAPIEGVINKGIAPENAFKRLTSSTKEIDALKKSLSPEDFAKIRGAWIDSLAKRDEAGLIRFPVLKSALENPKNKILLKKFFEDDPENLKDVLDLIKLGQSAGIDVLSTSGTAAGLKFDNLKNSMVNAVTNEVTLESLKNRARARGLALPTAAPARKTGFKPPLFGPRAIGATEAFGLRLPQQISIQSKERNP